MFNLVQLLANRVKSAGENSKMEKSAVVLGNSLPNPGPTRLGQLAGVNETKASHQTGLTKELTNPYQPSVAPKPTEGLTAFTGNDAVKDVSHSPVRSSVAPVAPKPSQFTRIPRATEPRGVGIGKVARNTGISDIDGNLYVNTEDVELLGKLGFGVDVDEYIELEKTSEAYDLYSYIEKVAGVPKEVAKAVDKGEAFSGSLLEDMGYSVPEGYEIKGDLCCPIEKEAAADPSQTILITGHSGSGKTTLSRQLAEKLNIPVRRVDAHRGWDNYIRGDDKRWKETLTPGTKEHSYFTNLVHRATKDTLKNAPEAGIIEGTQLGHLTPEELAKFKAHIVVGGSRDQSILQRIQRSVDKAAKSGVTFSPEEMDTKRIKAKYVADFWEPGIEKFRKLPSALHYNHSEHELEPLIKKLQRLLSKKASTDTPYSQPTVENPYPGIIGDLGVNALEAGAVYGANKMRNNSVQAALGKGSTPVPAASLLNKAKIYGNIGKAVPAAGAAAQASGAYDRYKKQDYLGAAIDGVGAVGSAAQLVPHPVAKGVGLGVSAASTVANAGRDIHRYNNRPVEFRHDPAVLSNPGESNPVQIPNAPLAKQGESGLEKVACAIKEASRLRDNVNITSHSDPSGLQEYKASIGDKQIGNMLVADVEGKGKVVAHSMLEPEFRGMGLGKKLYGEVMRRQPDGVLHSGPVVSDEASRVWDSLKRNKGYSVAGEAPELAGQITSKALNIPNKIKKVLSAPAAAEIKESLLGKIKSLLGKKAEATHELKSSNIKAVGYDKKEKELEVHFHSGGEYKYSDVPASLFHRLLKVKSPGKFFHKHIKRDNPFEYERLNKAAGIPEHVRKAMINGEREVLQRSQKASVASRLKNIAAKKHKDELSRLINMGEEKVVHPPSAYNNQTSLALNLPSMDYERTQKYILPRKS